MREERDEVWSDALEARRERWHHRRQLRQMRPQRRRVRHDAVEVGDESLVMRHERVKVWGKIRQLVKESAEVR